jgi:hypothetical protein
MIGRELWMKHHTHQSTFAGWFDVWNNKEGLWFQSSVLDNTNATHAFSKNHTAIGRPDN